VSGTGVAGAGGNNSRVLRDLTNTWAPSSGRDQAAAAPHSKAPQQHAADSARSKAQQQQQQEQQRKQHDASLLGHEGGLDISTLQQLVGITASEVPAPTSPSALRHQEGVRAAELRQLQATADEDPSSAGSSSGTAVPAQCDVAGAAPAGAATSSAGAGSKVQGTGSSAAGAPIGPPSAGSGGYRGGSASRRGSGGLKRKQTDAQGGAVEPGDPSGSSSSRVRKQVRFADLPGALAPAACEPAVTCLQLPPSAAAAAAQIAAAAAAAQIAAAGGGQGRGADTVGEAKGVGCEEHQQEVEQTRQHGLQHPTAQKPGQQRQRQHCMPPLKEEQPPAAAGANDRPLQAPAAAGLAAAQACHTPGATTTSSSHVWVKQKPPILSLEELLTISQQQQQQQQPTRGRSGSSAWAGRQQQGQAASGAGGGLVREVLEEGHLVTQVRRVALDRVVRGTPQLINEHCAYHLYRMCWICHTAGFRQVHAAAPVHYTPMY